MYRSHQSVVNVLDSEHVGLYITFGKLFPKVLLQKINELHKNNSKSDLKSKKLSLTGLITLT